MLVTFSSPTNTNFWCAVAKCLNDFFSYFRPCLSCLSFLLIFRSFSFWQSCMRLLFPIDCTVIYIFCCLFLSLTRNLFWTASVIETFVGDLIEQTLTSFPDSKSIGASHLYVLSSVIYHIDLLSNLIHLTVLGKPQLQTTQNLIFFLMFWKDMVTLVQRKHDRDDSRTSSFHNISEFPVCKIMKLSNKTSVNLWGAVFSKW